VRSILLDKQEIEDNIFLLTFSREEKSEIYPGQFLSILHKSREKLLRRPFSILMHTENKISILMKKIGRGTESISEISLGSEVDMLYPLGKPFKENLDNEKTLFVAGGIGIAGIYSFIDRGRNQNIIIGDRDGEFERVAEKLFKDCLYVSERGDTRRKGRVTDFLDMFEFNTIVACGPKQMLNALKKQVQNKRYLAVCEEIMACGVGLCNGCVVKYDDNTFRRVCTDGPVLDGNRIVYE
jgi:dihydroorotate dehydrogenase electron transfer subunit